MPEGSCYACSQQRRCRSSRLSLKLHKERSLNDPSAFLSWSRASWEPAKHEKLMQSKQYYTRCRHRRSSRCCSSCSRPAAEAVSSSSISSSSSRSRSKSRSSSSSSSSSSSGGSGGGGGGGGGGGRFSGSGSGSVLFILLFSFPHFFVFLRAKRQFQQHFIPFFPQICQHGLPKLFLVVVIFPFRVSCRRMFSHCQAAQNPRFGALEILLMLVCSYLHVG